MLASDSDGVACAVKLAKNVLQDNSMKMLEDELKHIKRVYDKARGWSHEVVEWFGKTQAVRVSSDSEVKGRMPAAPASEPYPRALLLPLCKPIPVDRRESRLEDVRAALGRLAASGYVYSDDDISWRHVMLLGDEDEVVLVDFGCLESLDTRPAGDWVEEAISVLKDTIETGGRHKRALGRLASALSLSSQ